MRLILKKGKQQELIYSAKKDHTWRDLSKILNLNAHYISNELARETVSISDKTYEKLCTLSGNKFDEYIKKRLPDQWGRSNGGKKSRGNTKSFNLPKENIELAELSGIILGDGHIDEFNGKNKIRNYSLDIAGHITEDFDYINKYVSALIITLFNEKPKIKLLPKYSGVHLIINGKELVLFFKRKGILSGNKKKNNQGIPVWIKKNKIYLAACIRGLIDTDGSIHYISKNNKNLRISFTSYIPKLMQDVREALLSLGFHPSKIIREKQIFLSRKDEIDKYIKEIEFKNKKHLNRIKKLHK